MSKWGIMSPRTSSSRRPAESDVYTWLLLLAALFLAAADIALFMPLHDWYDFGKGDEAVLPPPANP